MLAICDRLLGCGGALLSSAWAGLPPAPIDKPNYRGSLDGFESFPLYLEHCQTNANQVEIAVQGSL